MSTNKILLKFAKKGINLSPEAYNKVMNAENPLDFASSLIVKLKSDKYSSKDLISVSGETIDEISENKPKDNTNNQKTITKEKTEKTPQTEVKKPELIDDVKKESDEKEKHINKTIKEASQKVEDTKINIPQEMRNIFWRVSCNGSMEEKAFDRFVNLAGAGLSHPDRYFYLYQARLDTYEDNARLELMKSTVVRNEELLTEIKKTEMELIHLNIATLRVEQ